MFKRLFILIILYFSFLFTHSQLSAHGVDSLGVTIRINSEQIQMVATPSVATFIDLDGSNILDDNEDGIISQVEFQSHRQDLLAYAKQHIKLVNEANVNAELFFWDIIVANSNLTNKKKGIAHIKLILRYRWLAPATIIDFKYTLLTETESVHLQVIDTDAQKVQSGELSSTNNFFRLKEEIIDTQQNKRVKNSTEKQKVKPIQTVAQAVWLTGVLHVLKGADHILFILALVLVVKKFQRIILPITSFTVSHSLALMAVALGFNHDISNWLIEACIAASIVVIILMGILTNKHSNTENKEVNSLLLCIVVGVLGSIHGLGFAQALTDSYGDLWQWTSSFLTLTLSVELTQLFIAVLGLFVIRWTTTFNQKYSKNFYRVTIYLIAAISIFWTFERLTIPLLNN